MEKIRQFLAEHPRKKGTIEEEMLEGGIIFYHLVSLLWYKTTRKFTKEFLIWQTQEVLEIMMNNLPENINWEDFKVRFNDEMNAIRKDVGNDMDKAFRILGMDIDNSFNLTFDFKIAFLIYLLEKTQNITLEEILKKYN